MTIKQRIDSEQTALTHLLRSVSARAEYRRRVMTLIDKVACLQADVYARRIDALGALQALATVTRERNGIEAEITTEAA